MYRKMWLNLTQSDIQMLTLVRFEKKCTRILVRFLLINEDLWFWIGIYEVTELSLQHFASFFRKGFYDQYADFRIYSITAKFATFNQKCITQQQIGVIVVDYQKVNVKENINKKKIK